MSKKTMAVVVGMSLLIIICILIPVMSKTPYGVRPVCRHIVLSQYAAYRDAGYTVELWHMKNTDVGGAGGYAYHIALLVKTPDGDRWVEQPPVMYYTTSNKPPGTTLLRRMSYDEVSAWIKEDITCP